MQEFLRRNFWTMNLAVLAVGSYLAAGLATEMVATVALKAPPPRPGKDAAAAPPVAKPVKPESKVSLSQTLAGHNLFDAEPVVVEPEPGEEGAGSEQQVLDIDIDLLGTLVSPQPEWSLATVKFQGASKLIRIGVKLLDRAEVVDIQPHYIVLQDGPKQRLVKLWGEPQGQKAGQAGPPRTLAATGPAPAAGGDAFAKGVKKTGPYDFQIDRGMLEENLQDLSKLGMQARIVPNYEDGKYHGFRMVGIRPDSLYKAIGMESGDLVKRVNGRDIDTPNKAIELFEQLRSSPTISLDVERRGQKITMTYQIK